MGKPRLAIQAYTELLKRVPHHTEGHLRLAIALESIGRDAWALPTYERFVTNASANDTRLDWAIQQIARLRSR
jgi:hypothetical protein